MDEVNEWKVHDPVFEAGAVRYDPVEKWDCPDLKVKGFWYFWDETWAYWHGPYSTEKEARAALDIYFKSL